MIVLDASAAIRSLGDDRGAHGVRDRLQGHECHAPHLFDAEVGQTLRRLAARGAVDAAVALDALGVVSGLVDHRYPHAGVLARRAWALRENVSFYDGLYVALAAELELPLLTGDARLARAPGVHCEITLVEPI